MSATPQSRRDACAGWRRPCFSLLSHATQCLKRFPCLLLKVVRSSFSFVLSGPSMDFRGASHKLLLKDSCRQNWGPVQQAFPSLGNKGCASRLVNWTHPLEGRPLARHRPTSQSTSCRSWTPAGRHVPGLPWWESLLRAAQSLQRNQKLFSQCGTGTLAMFRRYAPEHLCSLAWRGSA